MRTVSNSGSMVRERAGCECGRDTAVAALVCSSVSEDAVDDDDRIAEQLSALASRAERHGIRIAYEALAWGRHVNTYTHSWDIVRRADHPALGLCLDSFHILSRGSDSSEIRAIPGAKIFFLQLSADPALTVRLGLSVSVLRRGTD